MKLLKVLVMHHCMHREEKSYFVPFTLSALIYRASLLNDYADSLEARLFMFIT